MATIELKPKLYTERLELTLVDGSNPAHLEFWKHASIVVSQEVYKRSGPEVEQDALSSIDFGLNKAIVSINGVSVGRAMYYFIGTREDPTDFVGLISVIHRGPVADEGWALLPTCRGKGYATEAAKEVLRYCTQDLKMTELFATVAVGNKGSAAIAERIGLVKAPTTVHMDKKENPELMCFMLPGMEPFPQGALCARRGDHTPLVLPDSSS